jgi:hypothetical protein
MSVRQDTLDEARRILREWELCMPRKRWAGDEWVRTTGYRDFAYRLGVSLETARKAAQELDECGDIVLLHGSPFWFRFSVPNRGLTGRRMNKRKRSKEHERRNQPW